MLILRDAFYGVQQFNDFHARLSLPRTVLSQRLSHLVEAGVMAQIASTNGRLAGYELTAAGRSLWPALYALRAWGEAQAGSTGDPPLTFEHEPCNARLDATARCSRCGVVPPPEDVQMGPGRSTDGRNGRDDTVAVGVRGWRRLLTPLPSAFESTL